MDIQLTMLDHLTEIVDLALEEVALIDLHSHTGLVDCGVDFIKIPNAVVHFVRTDNDCF